MENRREMLSLEEEMIINRTADTGCWITETRPIIVL